MTHHKAANVLPQRDLRDTPVCSINRETWRPSGTMYGNVLWTEVIRTVWTTWIVLMILVDFPSFHLRAIELDSIVERETSYAPHPQKSAFHPKLMPLWLAALGSSEVDLQRQAAQAIVKAHRQGMLQAVESVPQLITLLKDKELHFLVALEVARALIELDAKQSSETLMDLAQREGLSMSLLVEPMLARWDYPPMREVWLSRLDRADVELPLLLLAIKSLGQVAEPRATERLRLLTLDEDVASHVRVNSARSAGQIQRSGLEGYVGQLLQPPRDARLVNRLAAALLLRHHDGVAAERLLLKLAVDTAGTVGVSALSRLVELAPPLVTPINEVIVASPDAGVRRLAAESLVAQRTVTAVELLGPLLNDPIPSVRIYVADSLVALDEDEALRSMVREAATKMLMADEPLGVEQSAMVLGAIDHEPAANRLVELLEAEDPAVRVSAAWALRQLAVKETGDAIFAKIRRETKRTIALDDELWETWNKVPAPTVDFASLATTYRQLDQLLMALGLLKYDAGLDFLKTFFPTPAVRGMSDPPAVAATFITSCRAHAIWSASRVVSEGTSEKVVATLLEIVQKAPPGPSAEPHDTRAAAVLGLAHLQVPEAIPILRKYRGEDAAHNKLGATCGRVLHELTDDPLPELVPLVVNRMGWFLEPLP